MKALFPYSSILFVIGLVIWLSGCDKQPGNSSSCPAGYEGEFCDSLSYLKYIGSYQASENCFTSPTSSINNSYSSFISQGPRLDMITLSNFSNRGLPIDIQIVDGQYLVINDQPAGAIDISGGQGEYNRFTRQIKLEYNYIISGNLHQCTAVFRRF